MPKKHTELIRSGAPLEKNLAINLTYKSVETYKVRIKWVPDTRSSFETNTVCN